MADELGWVIERYLNSELRYWNGRGTGHVNFSNKPADAIRFAREMDAHIVLGWLLGGQGRVTQHVWVMTEKEP